MCSKGFGTNTAWVNAVCLTHIFIVSSLIILKFFFSRLPFSFPLSFSAKDLPKTC